MAKMKARCRRYWIRFSFFADALTDWMEAATHLVQWLAPGFLNRAYQAAEGGRDSARSGGEQSRGEADSGCGDVEDALQLRQSLHRLDCIVSRNLQIFH